MSLTNKERGRLDRLKDRCHVLQTRLDANTAGKQDWEQELSALSWAVAKIEAFPPEAPLNDARLSELAKRVIDYDNAIESCGNDPDKMSSLCTAQGDDLDTLYFMMVDAAKAIKRDETIPSPLLEKP